MSDRKKAQTTWTEFECPGCDAYNPYDDGFSHGDELFCNYCGMNLEVRLIRDSDPPRYKLVES